jgi:hypothetical protein
VGHKLQEEYSKWGFTMNIAETKYMSEGNDTNHLQMDNSDIITSCTEFRYLETIFTKEGRDTKNISHKITQARKIIGVLNWLWWSKNITRNRKKMIYNSMVNALNSELNSICHLLALLRAHHFLHISRIRVKIVLIYGAETCSLYEDDRRRINATEMDALTLQTPS